METILNLFVLVCSKNSPFPTIHSVKMSAQKRAGEGLQEQRDTKRTKMNLVYPFASSNNLTITPPFINVGNGLAISDLTLNLKVGNGLYFDNGVLSVVGSQEFKVQQPLVNEQGTQILKYGSPLFLNEAGELTMPSTADPLTILNDKLALQLSDGITVSPNGLTLNLDSIFFPLNNKFMLNCGPPLTKEGGLLSVKAGNGIQLEGDQLECTLSVNPPLSRMGTEIALNLGQTLQLSENKLEVKTAAPITAGVNGLNLQMEFPLLLTGDKLTLNVGETLQVLNNKLQVKPVAPLTSNAGGLQLQTGTSLQVSANALQVKPVSPLANSPTGLSLQIGSSLQTASNLLQVKPIMPLLNSADGLKLQLGNSLQSSATGLNVKPVTPLTNTDTGLQLSIDSSLQVTPTGLQVKPVAPLLNGTGGLSLQSAAPLQIQNQKLGIALADYFSIENNKLCLKVVKGGGLGLSSQGLFVSLATPVSAMSIAPLPATRTAQPAIAQQKGQTIYRSNLNANVVLMTPSGMTACPPEELYKDKYEQDFLQTHSGVKLRYQRLALGPVKFINIENYMESGTPIEIPAADFVAEGMSDNLMVKLTSKYPLVSCTSTALIVFHTSQGVLQETVHMRFLSVQNETHLLFLRERSTKGMLKSVILKSLPVFIYLTN
ncbi:MAG: fiber protein 1 [psittacine adenovirus 7]|uniref:Fiber protein 1 n=1 Tax=psittacine adenovirus 7 TaxID=2848040 RepID=A0A6B9LIP2_9ADEN|nr:MAG: fiber protein 1 [psittacine adenovirus 7]QHB43552.1 MAG: fiber protein 1 [psittacine adenovirus 7]